ncbi:hypothetical protein [Embleya sp. NPDC005575]|uniref:hypothetical protein n=1 Tax=Embleya sp. NPDC005575 TaxID=3156892 RepID=UPI0033ACF180
MYWLTHGELHQVAASSAPTLGEPGRRALEPFDADLAHDDLHDTTGEARGAVQGLVVVVELADDGGGRAHLGRHIRAPAAFEYMYPSPRRRSSRRFL